MGVCLFGLRAEVHGAEAKPGDFQAGAAELRVLHAIPSQGAEQAHQDTVGADAFAPTHVGERGQNDRPGARRRSLAFQSEAELDGYLPIGDLAVFEVSADFFNLKPVEVPQGLGGLSDAIAHGCINPFARCSDNFRNAVSVIRQLRSS